MFDWVQSPLHPMTRCIKPPPFHPTNTIVNANHFRHCALAAGRMANTARALCDCSQPHTADGHSFSRSVVVDLSRRVCLPLVRRVARTPHTPTHTHNKYQYSNTYSLTPKHHYTDQKYPPQSPYLIWCCVCQHFRACAQIECEFSSAKMTVVCVKNTASKNGQHVRS